MYNSFGKYKTTSRVQIFLGLCLACCFILSSSSHITFAIDDYDHNLYPVKSSRILSEDTTVSKDLGLVDCQYSLVSSNVTGGLLYVDYVLNMVENALSHVDSYFTSSINISFNKSDLRSLLISGDQDYFIDRERFLNVYLVIDDNNNGSVWFQYNKGYYGFSGMPYTVGEDTNYTTIYYDWFNYSSLNFASTYEYNNSTRDYISCVNGPIFVFSPNNEYQNLHNYEPNIVRYNYSDYLSGWYDSYNTANRFFRYLTSTTIDLHYCLDSKYVLPLYIDSDIYFPLSFVSPYNNSIEIHGDFNRRSMYLNACLFYTPNLGNISSDYFNSSLWYAGEFQSGIKGTSFVDPIVTPIPTFGPIYTPTPFPSINISATLTPIAIPNDPYINVGNADPISTVVGIFSYLMTMFATPFFGFVKYTLQYVYNSSVYWQILLFLIPGVVLIAFLIGRLKRK